MAYTKINWEDLPSTNTPINAENLNKMDLQIAENEDKIAENKTAISDIAGKILWTNSDPTIAFTSQTITLSSNNYDILDFVFELGTTGTSVITARTIKGKNTNASHMINLNEGSNQATGVRQRQVLYSSDTIYSVSNCVVREGGSSSVPTVSNNYLIPIYVIGYKTGLFN